MFNPAAIIRAAVFSASLLACTAHVVVAQAPAPARSWEFRLTSGALVPTGDQRNGLKDARADAVQVSWIVRPSLALTGTLGWARSRDLGSVDTPKLDVFTSDLGFEVRSAPWFADRAVTFSPFAGLGAGARSYNYRTREVDATYNIAGYAAAGGEIGVGRVGVRLEVRDYATGFKPLVGGGTAVTRNDVMIMVGVRFNRSRAPRNE